MTVVFIDIADSTSLSERLDPEEFFSVLREYRDICDRLIQRYGGVIARTVGDGLLAYFGLPQAHADDPENAALAGLAIAAAMRKHEFATSEIGPVRLGVRIGINTGLVVVGSLTGEPGIERRDVFGTPANIAARLQGTAPLNGVIIGPATHDLVKGAFRCTRLGEQQIKGVKKPIAVWRVDGIARTEGRFEKSRTAPLTPMIGRAAECSRLVDLWQQAVAGSGSVVVVSGGRGIGKSRLIQALRVAVAGVEKETLHFQCSPLQVNTPLAPLIERDRQQAGIEQDDSPEEMVAKLQAILAAATADTQTPIAYYGALHSIPACTGYTPANLSKPKELERALQVITDVVTSLSRRRPVLIIVEDVQWIDPTSVSLLERLMVRIDRERLLLVISHNEEIDPYWLAERKALPIPLAKLEPRECERMVQAVAGEAVLPRGVVRSILDRADGVPLYIEACTRSVLVTAAQGPGGRRVSSALLKEPVVPPSLHDAIMERLDHLGEARRIAQVASIFGRQFDFMGLRHIADMPKRSLAAALQSLEKAGLLTRQRKSPGNVFSFKHAMIQEVAYGSLLKETRTELHARAVARLRQVDVGSGGSRLAVLGYHYSRAGLLAEAVGAWLDAGKEALSRSANREAIANLWEGLELVAKLPSAEERHQLELVLQAHLGMAYTAMVGWAGPQVDQPYNRALELCRSYGTAREKAIVLWGVTIAALVNSQLGKALEFANEFVGLAEQWDDEEALLMANATAVLANFFCGRLEPARMAARVVCERYDKDVHGGLVQKCQHDPKVVALVYLGHIEWLLGNPHEAKAACEAARQLARELGHPFMLAFALILGACDHLYERDHTANLASVEEGVQLAKDHGFTLYGSFGPLWAIPALAAKDGAALDNLSGLLKTLLDNHYYLQAPLYQVLLAAELGRTGQVAKGRSLAQAALALMQRTGERWFEPEVFRVSGVLASLSPDADPAGAARFFQRSLDAARSLGTAGWELRAAISFAHFLRQRGQADKARSLLTEVKAKFPASITSTDLREADILLEELTAGPPPRKAKR
jgi:class 3 adenylate cyclase